MGHYTCWEDITWALYLFAKNQEYFNVIFYITKIKNKKSTYF